MDCVTSAIKRTVVSLETRENIINSLMKVNYPGVIIKRRVAVVI